MDDIKIFQISGTQNVVRLNHMLFGFVEFNMSGFNCSFCDLKPYKDYCLLSPCLKQQRKDGKAGYFIKK